MMKHLNVLITMVIAFSGWSQGTYHTEAKHKKEGNHIEWLTFEEAFEKHQKEPRRWMIDISTSWCGWCKRMDATTFSDSLIIPFVNENYYAVALDGEYKGEIVVGEQTYKFVPNGRRGYHELPAELMNGKLSYPTVVFLNEKLQNLSPLGGYRTAQDFHPILEFFATYNSETPITWDDFMKSYESPYPKN